jgi:hypothetical protein
VNDNSVQVFGVQVGGFQWYTHRTHHDRAKLRWGKGAGSNRAVDQGEEGGGLGYRAVV